MTTALSCDQIDCPIADTGRCLEGFPTGKGCPHLTSEGSGADSDVDGADSDRAADQSDIEEVDGERDADDATDLEDFRPAPTEWVSLGGDDALTAEEADAVALLESCRVVLVAGEYESGKTTLVAELYAQFLEGPFAGCSFGGSRTLRAFEHRLHPSRERSGQTTPDTDRTANDGMRLLHLLLSRDGERHTLLFSDVWGEFFENVINGSPIAQEVPLADRADVCLVAVDGATLARTSDRQRAITRARQLLGGLSEQGGLSAETVTVIMVTKADLLDADSREWAGGQVESLCEWARESRGLNATTLFVSARPDAAPIEGLPALLDLMLPVATPYAPGHHIAAPGDRQFWIPPERSA